MRLVAAVALALMLLVPARARAQGCDLGGRNCFGPAESNPCADNPACSLFSAAFTAGVTLLPISAAMMGRDRVGRHHEIGLSLALAHGVYAGVEAGMLYSMSRRRPVEHWLVLLATRGAATLLAFYGVRDLERGTAVLATMMLTAAAAVPAIALPTEPW